MSCKNKIKKKKHKGKFFTLSSIICLQMPHKCFGHALMLVNMQMSKGLSQIQCDVVVYSISCLNCIKKVPLSYNATSSCISNMKAIFLE